jgi:hypothetical protein
MSFWLRDLPTVMRNQGWRTGAACMERWFNTPARIMSLSEKNGRIDYTTLRAGPSIPIWSKWHGRCALRVLVKRQFDFSASG